MKAFISLAEMYDGQKYPMRVFADTKEEARNKLIKQFPQCYVSEAMTTEEYGIEKKFKELKDSDNKMINEVEQAFQQGYAQAKKETAQALDKLKEKIQDKYWEAVNDAQHYYNPNVAQDALEDAYSTVECWINEIFNGSEEAQENN